MISLDAEAAKKKSSSSSSLGVGLRHHILHTNFEDWPYDDGDLSYGVAYEIHESGGCWQVAVDYAHNVGETNVADYVITPQLNLLFKDNAWRGGVGALASYIKYDEEESPELAADDGWSDIYWQFLLGLSIPLGGLSLDVYAAYPFEEWGEISEFEFDDVEVQAWLMYAF